MFGNPLLSKKETRALRAAAKEKDPQKLARAVRSAPHGSVSRAAAERIEDPALAYKLAMDSDVSGEICLLLAEKLREPDRTTALIAIACRNHYQWKDEDPNGCLLAIDRISDESSLARVAALSDDSRIIEAAIARIHDQKILKSLLDGQTRSKYQKDGKTYHVNVFPNYEKRERLDECIFQSVLNHPTNPPAVQQFRCGREEHDFDSWISDEDKMVHESLDTYSRDHRVCRICNTIERRQTWGTYYLDYGYDYQTHSDLDYSLCNANIRT
ncbi:MAG: hypothetical protein LBJ11_05355 [Oscillospiraceae bacterium]|nr:hypothetical protein [Oscillospiraceae bacterium]